MANGRNIMAGVLSRAAQVGGGLGRDQLTILLILRLLERFGGSITDFFNLLNELERRRERRERFKFEKEEQQARRKEWKRAEKQWQYTQAQKAAAWANFLGVMKENLPLSEIARSTAIWLGMTPEKAEAVAELFSSRMAVAPQAKISDLLKTSDLPSEVLSTLAALKLSRQEAALAKLRREREMATLKRQGTATASRFDELVQNELKTMASEGKSIEELRPLAEYRAIRKVAADLWSEDPENAPERFLKFVNVTLPKDARDRLATFATTTLLTKYGITPGVQTKEELRDTLNSILESDFTGSPEVAILLNLKREPKADILDRTIESMVSEISRYAGAPEKFPKPRSLVLGGSALLSGLAEYLGEPETYPTGLRYFPASRSPEGTEFPAAIGPEGKGKYVIPLLPLPEVGPEKLGWLNLIQRIRGPERLKVTTAEILEPTLVGPEGGVWGVRRKPGFYFGKHGLTAAPIPVERWQEEFIRKIIEEREKLLKDLLGEQ